MVADSAGAAEANGKEVKGMGGEKFDSIFPEFLAAEVSAARHAAKTMRQVVLPAVRRYD
jgi:hypothetical protein